MPIILDGTSGITTPALTVSGATVNTGGISTAGNLTFTSTGQRITGDFSNSTLANRLMFQTSTANSNSILSVIPNGTATTTAFQAFNNSDPTNASQADLRVSGSTDVRLSSTSAGSGTYLPLTFYTNGSERMRIDTAGFVGINTSAPTELLNIASPLTSVRPAGSPTILVYGDNNTERICVASSIQPVIQGRAYGGTYASKSAVVSGQYLSDFQGQGYYDSSNLALGARIAMVPEENWSSTARGSYIAFSTIAPTTTTVTEKMRITGAGNVGIGTSSPTAKLHVVGGTTSAMIVAGGASSTIRNTASSGSSWFVGTNVDSYILHNESNTPMLFTTNGSERMRITSVGNVGIGTSAPSAKLHVYTTTTEGMYVESGSVGNGGKIILKTTDNADTAKYIMVNAYWTEIGVNSNEGFRVRNTSNNIIFSVSGAAGNCVISGSLSKGSGSFRIDHPLPELEETHQLVHSFIEGPQADLIYRGVVTLVNGKAEVNIDEAAGMTYGTFEVLCRDVQCFTTNESDWVAVRGKVSGNILTIEAQDSTATSTISWMVIGERKDKHMMETDWTDSNGKVIVEPLKPVN